MKTVSILRKIYDVADGDIVPAEIFNAYLVSSALERGSSALPKDWNTIILEHYSLLKMTGRTQRSQRRISFGEARFSNPSNPTEVVKTEPLSDKINREIASGPVVEKFIYPLFNMGGVLDFAKAWVKQACGSHESLLNELGKLNITTEQLTADFNRIIGYFEKNRPAVIGYKSSWKLSQTYDEVVCYIDYKTLQRKYRKTGKKFSILPKFRRYLIQVIKDKDAAARAIQKFVRTRAHERQEFDRMWRELARKHQVLNA